MSQDDLIALAKAKAIEHSLDPALVCAVVEQESTWRTYAMRFEPGFLSQYVVKEFQKGNISQTECYARSMSWGLGQVMGLTARELGFEGEFLCELSDPSVGLEFLCRKLKAVLQSHGGDVTKALLSYNGGKRPEYANEVLARLPSYGEAPSVPQVDTAASLSPRIVPIDHPAA
jgi:soluble lytic murein transglycosylase-like protein